MEIVFFSDCDNLHDILNKKDIIKYQLSIIEGVLQKGCSWRFRSTWGAVLASLLDKVACLRDCNFVAKRPQQGYFPVGIAEFFFCEHLVAASVLFVLQKLCFLNFDALRFII